MPALPNYNLTLCPPSEGPYIFLASQATASDSAASWTSQPDANGFYGVISTDDGVTWTVGVWHDDTLYCHTVVTGPWADGTMSDWVTDQGGLGGVLPGSSGDNFLTATAGVKRFVYFLYVATGPVQDLGSLDSYRITDVSGTGPDLGPATTLPVAGDEVAPIYPVGESDGTVLGASPANWRGAVIYGGDLSFFIYGGLFTGIISTIGLISGGVFTGPSVHAGQVSGGDFTGATVAVESGTSGGTFNDCTFQLGYSAIGGTWNFSTPAEFLNVYMDPATVINGDLTVAGNSTINGTVNGSLMVTDSISAGGDFVLNGKMYIGGVWLYSPNSPDVAPSSVVLADDADGNPVYNLGVRGGVSLSQVLPPLGQAVVTGGASGIGDDDGPR